MPVGSETPDIRVVALSRRTWAALGAAFLVLLGVFAVMIALLLQQRELISQQRHIAARQAARSQPLLRTVDELLGSGAGVRGGARRAGILMDDLQRADLPRVGALLAELLPELRTLPGVAATVRRTADTLGRSYVTQRESLARTDASLRVQRRTLALLAESLRVQRGTQATSAQTLDVARETLAHVRSLDAKTGGSPPAVLTPPR
jgi:hypothetical protein